MSECCTDCVIYQGVACVAQVSCIGVSMLCTAVCHWSAAEIRVLETVSETFIKGPFVKGLTDLG